jgi:hypothetical protein
MEKQYIKAALQPNSVITNKLLEQIGHIREQKTRLK